MSSMQTSDSRVIYRFDRFELIPGSEELRKQGVLVHLAPQPFRVLRMLLSRGGGIVTREEIQEELWGVGTFVDFEQGINAVIRRIRFALNDQAETPRFLETLPRRGYRFLVPVELIETPVVESADSREPAADQEAPALVEPALPLPARGIRWRSVAAALATAAVLFLTSGPHRIPPAGSSYTGLSIAISPVRFEGVVADLDPQSIAAELRGRLAQVQPDRIRVAAPGDPGDLRIDASIWKAPEGYSVQARMTEMASGRQVWSETFRHLRAPADVTLEVTVRVTRAVVELYVPRVRWEPQVRPSVSPAALALYREAQAIRKQPGVLESGDRAVESLRKAVALEPRFAEAWSAMGDLWTGRAMAWRGPSRAMALEEARVTLRRAHALDPRDAQTLNNQGVMLMVFDRSYGEAEAKLRKAIEVDGSYLDARVNLAPLLAATGRHAEAVAEMRRVQVLDPFSHVPSPTLAFLYLIARRHGEALAEYRATVILMRRPEPVHLELMSSAMGAGRWDEAARSLSLLLGDRVVLSPDAVDRGAEFRKHLRRLAPLLDEKARAGLDPYTLAWFHAQTGDADSAFAALDRAEKEQSLYAMFAFADPRFDPIREDPRFIDQLMRLGFLR